MAKTSFFGGDNTNAVNPQDFNLLVSTLEDRNALAAARLLEATTLLDSATTTLAQTTATANEQLAQSIQSASNASTSATNAANAEARAVTARTGSETARTGAETAKTAAETARDSAQAQIPLAQAEVTKAAAEVTKAAAEVVKAQAEVALAKQWATQTNAEVVAGQGFGALKYANDAAASASNSNANFVSFKRQYQGALSAAPTLRYDSTALQTGDLYFDTNATPQPSMKVYNGTAWINAGSTVNGTSKRGAFVATAGQTTFAIPGGYDAGFIDVYLNGVRQKAADDVTVASGTSVVFTKALAVGDEVEYVAFGAFAVADTYNQATIDSKVAVAAQGHQYRNKIINGAFDVWQRGTSFDGTFSRGTYYGADRWQNFRASGAAGATYSRIAYNGPNALYAMRMQRDAGNTGTQTLNLGTSLESTDVYMLKGKTVTLSFRYLTGANFSGAALRVSGNFGTGVDGSLSVGFSNPTNTTIFTYNPSTTQQYVSVTFDIPANASQFGISFGYFPTGTAGAADYVEITNVQLEIGSVATPFEYRPYPVELLMCQRYYQIASIRSVVAQVNYAGLKTPRRVLMRVAPTITYTDAVGTANKISTSTGNGRTVTAGGLSSDPNAHVVDIIMSGQGTSDTWWEINEYANAEL